MRMDRIDRAIIRELTLNGRISNVDLADKVNLTPGPCLRRVQRLEESGTILGYRAVVDSAALGRGFEVILDVDLKAFDRETVYAFEASMAGFDEVTEIRRMFGSPDYFVRVAVSDLQAYEAFLSESVMALPGILKVHSRFTMKSVKSPQ